MRHNISRRKLNRRGNHLKALLANMAISLIDSESMLTTTAKAKELRCFVEPLVTKARQGSLASKRALLGVLYHNDRVVKKLVDDLAVRFKDRPGGYVRVLKAGLRSGDGAPMSVIQFVDYPEKLAEKKRQEMLEAQKAGEKPEQTVLEGGE